MSWRGRRDLVITGSVAGLPETVFPTVAAQPGISAATPLVRGMVTLPDLPGEYLIVLGVDIFTNAPFRTFELTDFKAGEFDLQRWLGEANAIAVSEEFARLHHLHAGDALRVQVNGTDRSLRVGFILRSSGASALDPHFAAMDIGWAQEFFGRRGVLSSIQVQLTPPRDRDAVSAGLRSLLPPDASVATPVQRGEQVEKMLGGFELNLTAMSLVSLLVGMFLIYNTVSASVVRRRSEIGILRSLGTTRNEVRALFLAEALALGVIGVVRGIDRRFAARASSCRDRFGNDFVALRFAQREGGGSHALDVRLGGVARAGLRHGRRVVAGGRRGENGSGARSTSRFHH